jgi:hypothetical protein
MAATTIEPAPDAGEQPASKTKAEPEAAPAPVPGRTLWRAVVRTGGQISASRERDRVEWHLAACEVPHAVGKHCTDGQHLIETIGHPDGHCIINGTCGLCGAPERPTE